jgi:hypothetical protein
MNIGMNEKIKELSKNLLFMQKLYLMMNELQFMDEIKITNDFFG